MGAVVGMRGVLNQVLFKLFGWFNRADKTECLIINPLVSIGVMRVWIGKITDPFDERGSKNIWGVSREPP